MLRNLVLAAGFLSWLAPPLHAEPPESAHVHYSVYATGLHVAEVDAVFGLGPWSYQMNLSYHTTGLVGFFYHGHQLNEVTGTWSADQAEPLSFSGTGEWGGQDRYTRIDYQHGMPVIRQMVPPNDLERLPVPPALQDHSIDSLSAIMTLIHTVARTGQCDTSAHTFDGRRASEIVSHTVGLQVLQPTSRSSFAGRALRCDFTGKMLAGFRRGDEATDAKPLHGSAWLAAVLPDGPLLPVRMAFETRWFGDATMFLTQANSASLGVAAKN